MRKLMNIILICIILTYVLIAGCSTPAADILSSSAQTSSESNPKYTVTFPDVAGDVPDVTFNMAIPVSNLPDKVNIYRMVKPEITLQYMSDLENKFGLTGEILQGDEGFTVKDSNSDAYLDVYKVSGTVQYRVGSKLYPDEKPVLPTDAEAKKIAMDFLSERSLLPEGDVASSVSVGGTSAAYGPAHLLVGFTHVIDLAGPGAKHGVRVGNNSEVIDVFINPTNPLTLPVQEVVPAKSLNEAYQEMQTIKKYTMPLDARRVTVTNVKVAYWIEPISQGQDYVVPVYIFGGQCLDNTGKQVGNFSGYAHAVN